MLQNQRRKQVRGTYHALDLGHLSWMASIHVLYHIQLTLELLIAKCTLEGRSVPAHSYGHQQLLREIAHVVWDVLGS